MSDLPPLIRWLREWTSTGRCWAFLSLRRLFSWSAQNCLPLSWPWHRMFRKQAEPLGSSLWSWFQRRVISRNRYRSSLAGMLRSRLPVGGWPCVLLALWQLKRCLCDKSSSSCWWQQLIAWPRAWHSCGKRMNDCFAFSEDLKELVEQHSGLPNALSVRAFEQSMSWMK